MSETEHGGSQERTDAARSRLREALAGYLTEEELQSLVRECLSVKKQASLQCKHCGKQSYGEVIDSKGVASALTSLLETAAGRLGTISPDGEGGGIEFVHKSVFACSCGKECEACTAEQGETYGYAMQNGKPVPLEGVPFPKHLERADES